MAVAKKEKGAGHYAENIGYGVEFHCIAVELEADGEALFITRIAASYADDDRANGNLTGRILVLRELMRDVDTLLDPAGIDTGGASPTLHVEMDESKTVKKFEDFVRVGEPLIIPQGQKWHVILTSAYSDGDAFAEPSPKRAKLLIKTVSPQGPGGQLQPY